MSDTVNHPDHYTGFSNGAEVIDITENLTFNLGNVVKYVARAGRKDPEKTLEDLRKAQFYLNREINKLLEEANPWTLAGVQEELNKLWDQRKPTVTTSIWDGDYNLIYTTRDLSFEVNVTPRQWNLLDHVPPGVIVEDQDGDRYRRVNGTSKFEFSAREYSHGQHYEWQPVWPTFYLRQADYAPFKEVTSE